MPGNGGAASLITISWRPHLPFQFIKFITKPGRSFLRMAFTKPNAQENPCADQCSDSRAPGGLGIAWDGGLDRYSCSTSMADHR